MVIFQSYVSLPEGKLKVWGLPSSMDADQKIQKGNQHLSTQFFPRENCTWDAPSVRITGQTKLSCEQVLLCEVEPEAAQKS